MGRRVRIALATLIVVAVLAIVAYMRFVPRNTFINFTRSNGGRLTFSRWSIRFDPPPHHYESNGLDHIGPYIEQLLVPSHKFKALSIFTADGQRGFGLSARDGLVQANLTVEWRDDPAKEAAIRAFFRDLGATPSQDYLAGNGGVADATRVLDYPLRGDAHEVTALTQRILSDICGVSPGESLNIEPWEK